MEFSFIKNHDEPLYVNDFTPSSIVNSDYTFTICVPFPRILLVNSRSIKIPPSLSQFTSPWQSPSTFYRPWPSLYNPPTIPMHQPRTLTMQKQTSFTYMQAFARPTLEFDIYYLSFMPKSHIFLVPDDHVRDWRYFLQSDSTNKRCWIGMFNI